MGKGIQNRFQWNNQENLLYKGGEYDDKTLVMRGGRDVPDGIHDDSLLA